MGAFILFPPQSDPRYSQTEFVVEATSFELLMLGKENDGQHTGWVQDMSGLCETVGYVDSDADKPVNITVFWYVIRGHRILFWEACSRFVDTQMIEKWFDSYCAPEADGLIARTNAMNFHIALNHIDRLEGASIG